MLQVFLLGQFKVEVNGGLIEIPSRPAQSLLAYLILNAGIYHRREKLSGLFWPDTSESNARAYLRQSLWRIRKALQSQSVEWQDYLTIDEIAVSFKSGADCWLDAAHILEQRKPDAWLVQELADAAGLYRGELLPGFYDDWVVPERERIRAAFEHKMHLLLDRLVGEGRWQAVMDWSERWIALGGVPEQAFRALMQAKAGQGDLPGVTGVYNRYMEVLRRELDVEPSAESTALYHQIASGALAASAKSSPPPAFMDPTSQRNPSEQTLFVPREAELAKLSGFLSSTLMGRGQAAFVTGEPGSGKTMLLQAFARHALDSYPDLIVLNGTCNAYTGLGDPYLPFLEMLEMLAGDVEFRWAGGLITQDHARRIWRLLPEVISAIVEDGPDLIDRFVSGSALLARTRSGASSQLIQLNTLLKNKAAASHGQQMDLFEQYTKVLKKLARSHPLLLLLDDLQWADTGSIHLLFHLGRHLPGHRILLLGAYRQEDVASGRGDSRHPLEPVLNELQRDYGDNQVDLSKSTSRQWIDALIDSEPNHLGQEFRAILFRHTNGQALFTVELLRGLQDRGDLVKDEAGFWVEGTVLNWDTLPPRVEAVIAESINRLPDLDQSILSIASVEGETFTAQAISRILGIENQETIRRLSGLLGQKRRYITSVGVQRVAGVTLSRYRFRHFMFQKFIYNHIDEVERIHLHEAMGNALEALYGEQSDRIALELARHFEVSGLTGKAVRYLHLAGDQAVRLYANTEAIRHYQRAIDLLQTFPDSPDRAAQELRLRTALGVPLTATHGFSDWAIEQNNQRAYELTHQVASTVELFQVLSGLKGFYDLRISLRAALGIAEDMLRLAEQLKDPMRQSFAYHHVSTTLLYLGRLDDFFEYRQRASACYDRDTFRAAIFQVGFDQEVAGLVHASWAYWLRGYPDQARQQSREALAWAAELGHPFMIAWARFFNAQLHGYLRDIAQTRILAEETVTLSREIGMSLWQAGGSALLGWVEAQEGRVEEAITHLLRVFDAMRATGAELGLLQQASLLLDTYILAGRAADGLAWVEELLSEASAAEYGMVVPDLRRAKGDLLLANGSPDADAEAEACYWQSIEQACGMDVKSWEMRSTLRLCRLWQRQGRVKDAYLLLSPVYRWFTEGFDTPDLIEARALLIELGGR